MASISAGQKAQLMSAYVGWATTSTADRKRLGLPESKAAWARANGITDRTLRNWEKEPHIVAALETAAAAVPAPPPLAPLDDVDPQDLADMSALERDYAEARGILMEKVREGSDPRWAQMWWNTFGKRQADAEQAAAESDFADLSDEELAGRVTALLSTEDLVEHLRSLGWTVSEPA